MESLKLNNVLQKISKMQIKYQDNDEILSELNEIDDSLRNEIEKLSKIRKTVELIHNSL